MAGSLARRSVVVLRHPERTVRIAAALKAAGMMAYAMPLTATELPSDPEAARRMIADLAAGEYRWVVVTSANTVRSLDVVARGSGRGFPDAIAGGGASVAAVGATTARVLAEAGIRADLVPDDASSAGLLQALGAGNGRIALPQADLAPEDLRSGLVDLGWTVNRVEAYRTVPYPADPRRTVPGVVEDGEPPPLVSVEDVVASAAAGVQTAVVFTAPSTVQQFRDTLGGGDLTFHPVAIGRTTAAAIREAGWSPVATAAAPTPGAIVDAVREAFDGVPSRLGRAVAVSPLTPLLAPLSTSPTSSPMSTPPIGDQP